MSQPSSSGPAGLSAVEGIKARSRGLRGTLQESLADPRTGAIAPDDTALLKFHGSYQQDDRDTREERRQQKLEPDYSFMIRTRLPGGRMGHGRGAPDRALLHLSPFAGRRVETGAAGSSCG